MSQPPVDDLDERIRDAMRAVLSPALADIGDRFDAIDTRLGAVDTRFDALERRMDEGFAEVRRRISARPND